MRVFTNGRSRVSTLAVLALLLGAVGAAQADEVLNLKYVGFNSNQTENTKDRANRTIVAGMYWWDDQYADEDVWTFCIEPGDYIQTEKYDKFYKLAVDGTDSRVKEALYGEGYTGDNQKGADIKELWLENMNTMFSSSGDVGTGNYTAGDGGVAAAKLQAAIWQIIDPAENFWGSKWNSQALVNNLDGTINANFTDFNEVYALIAFDNEQQNQAIVGFSANPAPVNPVPLPAAAWPCVGMLAGVVGWKKYRNRKLEV